MQIFGHNLAEIRKALVALAGVLTTLLTANLLPPTWAHWVSTAAGIITVVATFQVPNAQPTPAAVAKGQHEAAQ